jgi:hypothetical protein
MAIRVGTTSHSEGGIRVASTTHEAWTSGPRIVSLSPDPVRPGNTVTIIVQAGAGSDSPVVSSWPEQGTVSQLAVRPHLRGFGYDCVGGSGRNGGTPAIRRVTNTNETGTGSFRQALLDHNSGGEPSVIVFETSGTIRWSDNWTHTITQDGLTIAGQTAPSPGVTLRRIQLRVRIADFLAQHIRFRFGDNDENMDAGDLLNSSPIKIDGISTTGNRERIVFDQCSFSWGVDDFVNYASEVDPSVVTLHRCLFAEPLTIESQVSRAITATPSVSAAMNKLALIGSVFAHSYQRNPQSRIRRLFMANNLVYNWGDTRNASLRNSGHECQSGIVSNKFIPRAVTTGPIGIHSDSTSDASVYLHNNDAWNYVNDEWDLVNNESSVTRQNLEVTEAGIEVPEGFVALAARGNSDFEQVLLDHVGARPLDRDAVDARVINEIATRGGTAIQSNGNGTITSVASVGGFPTLAENVQAYNEPSDPFVVSASGYTNIEEHLETLAQALEP